MIDRQTDRQTDEQLLLLELHQVCFHVLDVFCDVSIREPHLAVLFGSVMPLRGGGLQTFCLGNEWGGAAAVGWYWVEAGCMKGTVWLGGFAESRGI